MKSLLPVVGFTLEFVWLVGVIWRSSARKATVIAYALSGLEDRPHNPIHTYISRQPDGGTHSIRCIRRGSDIDKGAFSVVDSDYGKTWCWGWKQEDVDALCAAYALR